MSNDNDRRRRYYDKHTKEKEGRKNMKKLMMILLVAMMLLMTTACSSNSNGNGTSTQKTDTIHVELTTAPVGMHPIKTNDVASTYVSGQVFETLYIRKTDGSGYEPLLAKEMPEYSEDGLSATIKLREDVKFHDGSAFTADDVAYMIDCQKDESYGAMRPSIAESIESYEIIDDHTIVLYLAYEDGVLLSKLAHENGAIVNPELDQSKDLMVDASGAGTGAYKFVSAMSGSNCVLEANEEYWGGAPEVKHVIFDVIGDESTAIARLQTGEADLYPTVSSDSVGAVKNISGFTTVVESSNSINYLALRSHEELALNPLMANVEFRKAILQAIDFGTYTETMLKDVATHSNSIINPSLVGYTKEMEEAGITYDFEASKKTIEENGWTNEKVTLFVSTRPEQQSLAVYAQAELAKVGLEVEIISEEWASFLSNAKQDKKYDMVFLTWANATGDGQQMLDPNFSTINGARVKYNNATFDALVDASKTTVILEEREAALLEAVKMLQRDAITTPAYSPNMIYTYNSDKFDNVALDKAGQVMIKYITVVE